ncbi:MAG: exo-alpha-sialidase [Planctomycetales bacterium]|nr:exo-alpha-sialidase [Planctomycetales bacterium]
MKKRLSQYHSRRTFHRQVAAMSAIAAASRVSNMLSAAQSERVPTAEVDEVRTISETPELYCGWPTLTRRRNGQLVVVWSGGRESHVCPFGRVEMIRSNDDGATWTWPRTILDGAIDDRDAGVVETHKGTLLVTTFTSLAYQPELDKQIALAADADKKQARWPAEKLRRWRAVHDRISAPERNAELGQWMIRSTDGGVTWSSRYTSIVNSPHGPIQLSDGRLLYAGKELWTGDRAIGVCESVDDGASWRWLAKIPARQGDDPAAYHELHAVEAASGRLIAHIRNHNKPNDRETLQSESDDGGRTWTTPHPIGVWGLPSFLTRLRDDRLLMTYGHRRNPLGIQARISSDSGDSWSGPMIIWGDGVSGDLGYPSTVEVADGSLVSVWYERTAESDKAVLRQARWRIIG